MTKDEALKLALEALEIEEAQTHYPSQWLLKAITAIKESLAQDALDRKAENARELALDYEPVAFASHGVVNWIADKQFQHEADLYATSHRKPLTDEEIEDAIDDGLAFGLSDGNVSNEAVIRYVRTIEAKLKEKNT